MMPVLPRVFLLRFWRRLSEGLPAITLPARCCFPYRGVLMTHVNYTPLGEGLRGIRLSVAGKSKTSLADYLSLFRPPLSS